MNLSAIAIRRPAFTVMVTVALIVLGLAGLSRLGTELFPDVSIPIVGVEVSYPGASPEEVETLVTRPIEDEVASVNGIDRVLSTSREGQASISVLFELGVPIEEAATRVRERVAHVRSRLPPDSRSPRSAASTPARCRSPSTRWLASSRCRRCAGLRTT